MPGFVDYVMAALAYVNEDKNDSWAILDVYEAFHRLSREHPDFFKEVYFSKRGNFWYSKTLEELFFQMGTSKLLEVMNPEYGCYLIRMEKKKQMREDIERYFAGDQKETAKTLANKFKAIMESAPSRGQTCSV